MSEIKAKKVLAELVQQSGVNYTLEGVLAIFKNKNSKYSKKNFTTVLTQLFKTVPNGSKYINEYNIDAKDTYAALIILMNNFANDTKNRQIEKQISRSESVTKSIANLFESPPLSSTRIMSENITPDHVHEIKDKIVQATSGAVKRMNVSSSLLPQIMSFSNGKQRIPEWNFNFEELYPLQNKSNVTAIPITSQERIILSEMLKCLIGIKGTLITVKQSAISSNCVEFTISDQIQESLKDMLEEILPLASHYSQIQNFLAKTSSPESGEVLQALRAALKELMNNYYLTIAQLDTLLLKEQLTIHKLLYFLRPIFHTMKILSTTISVIRETDTRGGEVLTLLHDQMTSLSGDDSSQKVLLYLTQMAAVPYMEILQLWILKGVIIDPEHEFFIEYHEKDSRSRVQESYLDDYWEKQYSIRSNIPTFLEKLADIILRTGKYLNVIRECGKSVELPQTTQLKFSHSDQNYVTFVENAYYFASSSLLTLIMNDHDLMGRLLSVKRYFLLQQGDFISQFMDACEQELGKNVDFVIPTKIENLLELTLRLSSAKHDKYQDDLRTMLLPYSIVTQISKIVNKEDAFSDIDDTSELKGIECFTFTYNVQWPVSIVLNMMAISKYQMIFRQLYYFKHVERILCRVWTANNNAKKFSHQTAELYRSAFTLRQKMMNAIQNFEYYMMVEVIEPNWHIFFQNINRAKNIDDVLTYHQDFLDQCLKNCMLTDPDLLKSVIHLCNVCIEFCEFIEEAQRHFVDAELSSMLCSNDEFSLASDSEYEFACQGETSMAPTETFSQRVKHFDTEFTSQLLELLKKITEVAARNTSDKFMNLIHRINFNSYYCEHF